MHLDSDRKKNQEKSTEQFIEFSSALDVGMNSLVLAST